MSSHLSPMVSVSVPCLAGSILLIGDMLSRLYIDGFLTTSANVCSLNNLVEPSDVESVL